MRRSRNGAPNTARAATASPAAEPGSQVSPFSLTGIQSNINIKVEVPGDAAEHEANRVADHIPAVSPSPQPTITPPLPPPAPAPAMSEKVRSQPAEASGKPESAPAAQPAAVTAKSGEAGVQPGEAGGKVETLLPAQPAAVTAKSGEVGAQPAEAGGKLESAAAAQPAVATAKSGEAGVHQAEAGSQQESASTMQPAPTQAKSAEPGEHHAEGGGKKESAPASAPQAPDQKVEAKSPKSDPAFLAVTQHVKKVATGQKGHAPASSKAAAAHAAVQSSSNEVPSRAAAKQTDEMDRQKPKPFNREAFKAALLKKIEDTAPKTLEAADDFKTNNNLNSVKSDLNGQVANEKKESQGPLTEKVEAKPDPSGIDPKPSTPLPPPETGAPPQIAAAGAAPKPASNQDISLDAGPKELDRQMAESQVTEEQLKDSNEPDFQDALAQKKDVEKQSVAAPQAYRAQEPQLLHAAQAEAQTLATKGTLGMHGTRAHAFGTVAGHQADAKTEEETQRLKIFGDIDGIYQTTKSQVEARLKKLDTDVSSTFDAGAAAAQSAFEDYVDVHMSAYKKARYDRIGGGLLWAKDKLFGLPDAVDAFYQEGHDLYVSRMDTLIDQIAALVETGLNEAKDLIAAGRASIQTYLAGLPAAEQETGRKSGGIQGKFDSLEQSVTDKQGELIDSLAKKYNDNLKKVNDRIDEMKEENSGLVHKVAGAIKGVIVAIAHLKDMLLNVLSRAAAAIGMIIAHPIRFLGNLVDAGLLGFNNFKDHIVEHLKEGFMQWLFGAVAATGIQLPKSFDLPGILGLVLQVLGLTYPNIRARAVNILGEKVVQALETTAEIFKVLIKKGPMGLWDYIKDKLGNVLETVIESIKSFVMEKIIYAGIAWIIGLLNPASAFIKACKAIYDIVMFFVEHGNQILDLVNAIIDSITAIAKGQISQAAAFVEKSLARAIPVIIGFLASLLGVGGISEKIKDTIDIIRKPINEAIDWVINKAVSLAKAVGGLLGFGKGKEDEEKTVAGKDQKDERTEEQKLADLDSAMTEAGHLADNPEATAVTVTAGLAPIEKKYRLNMLELDPESGDKYEIVGGFSPTKKRR